MSRLKLTGVRSVESKMHRLAYELEADAARIRADYPAQDSLANEIAAIASRLGRVSRSLGREWREA